MCVPAPAEEEEEGGAFLFDDTVSVVLLSAALAVIQYMKRNKSVDKIERNSHYMV